MSVLKYSITFSLMAQITPALQTVFRKQVAIDPPVCTYTVSMHRNLRSPYFPGYFRKIAITRLNLFTRIKIGLTLFLFVIIYCNYTTKCKNKKKCSKKIQLKKYSRSQNKVNVM